MIKPLSNNVVLKKEKKENQTSSGLYVPVSKEKLIIEEVGAEVKSLKKGQEVIVNGRGTVAKNNDIDYLIVKEEDILAIIE